MNIPEHYRKPLLIAALLHVLLLLAFIFHLSSSSYQSQSSAPKIIHASAISQATVNAEIKAVQKKPKQPDQEIIKKQEAIKEQQILQKRQEEQKQIQLKQQKVRELQAIAIAQKVAHQKIIQAQRQAALKLKAIQEQKQKLAQKKRLEREKQQQLLVLQHQKELMQKAEKMKQQKMLLLKQNALQQELMQQQMNTEKTNISAVLSQAQQGAIDQYKAQILSVIQSNWRIDKVNSQLKCVYSVSLAPDGQVLSAQLMKSSGDDTLDQSAEQAIMQSSPLPVPHEPALFDHFRHLILTLSPQGYLNIK